GPGSDEGFVLAAATRTAPRLALPPDAPAPLGLTPAALREATAAALRSRPPGRLPSSTLLRPRISE
ncbi:MAG TPA: spermidine synthase, partial [Streptomyces sp.]